MESCHISDQRVDTVDRCRGSENPDQCGHLCQHINISAPAQHNISTYQHINISITGTMGGDGDGNEDILTLYVRRGAVSLLGSHLQTTSITSRLTYSINSDPCYQSRLIYRYNSALVLTRRPRRSGFDGKKYGACPACQRVFMVSGNTSLSNT